MDNNAHRSKKQVRSAQPRQGRVRSTQLPTVAGTRGAAMNARGLQDIEFDAVGFVGSSQLAV
jgi:hypothetical protein